ncbi:MAG TPA: hypothetical protein GXX74_04250 [Clostridiales bacterium]|nr:hypothetical protein [Clostridiales bacterium]
MEEEEALRETYFAELDPGRRKELLERFSRDHPQDAEVPLFQTLWSLRHVDPKNAEHPVDTFLWQIVNLISLYRVPGFFSGGTEKEIRAAMDALGFSAVAKYGDKGREILYLELRNAARRYFSTCESKSYGKKLMGIVTMNESERRDKLAREVWQLTEGLSRRFETDEDMALFRKAVRDEFIVQYPDGEERLERQEKRRTKKRIA